MAHKPNNRVSSRDVARVAGVSQATVSRVFTPGKQVSEDKRKRVRSFQAKRSLESKIAKIKTKDLRN